MLRSHMKMLVILAGLALWAALSGAANATHVPGGAPLGYKWHTFSNPTPITSSPGATATPYPSELTVSGVKNISSIEVRLHGISHQSPSNLDILLKAPSGKSVPLMSDACANSLAGQSFMFTEYFPLQQLPQGNCSGLSGPLEVTDYLDGFEVDSYPGVDTSQPGTTSFHFLHAFLGGYVPDGSWSLHVVDDGMPSATAAGVISGGWSLALQDCCHPFDWEVVPCEPKGLPSDVNRVTGTDKDDVLVGTPATDVIKGLGGDDRIRGRGGWDAICGGPGKDTIRASRGNLWGEGGRDLLIGGKKRASSKRHAECRGGPGKDIAVRCRFAKSARSMKNLKRAKALHERKRRK